MERGRNTYLYFQNAMGLIFDINLSWVSIWVNFNLTTIWDSEHEILLIRRLLNFETSLKNMRCIILRNTVLAPE